MNKRPLDVTILAWLLIATGLGAAALHLSDAMHSHDELWMAAVQMTAVVAGIFLLRRQNWARWLALAWMGFHVAISIGNPIQQIVVHSMLLVAFAIILFRSAARGYFASAG